MVVVNNAEATIRRNMPQPVTLPGLDYTPSQKAQLAADAFYTSVGRCSLTPANPRRNRLQMSP